MKFFKKLNIKGSWDTKWYEVTAEDVAKRLAKTTNTIVLVDKLNNGEEVELGLFKYKKQKNEKIIQT